VKSDHICADYAYTAPDGHWRGIRVHSTHCWLVSGSSPEGLIISGDGYKLPIEEKPPGRGDPFWDHFGILVRRYPELTKLLNKRMSLGSLSG